MASVVPRKKITSEESLVFMNLDMASRELSYNSVASMLSV